MKLVLYPVGTFVGSYLGAAFINLEPWFWMWSEDTRFFVCVMTGAVSISTVIASNLK